MKNLFNLFVGFIMVLILLMVGVYFFTQFSEGPSEGVDEIEVVEEESEELEESDVVYYTPVGEKVNLSQNGPWRNNLEIATSEDGIDFSLQTLLVEKAGVPSMTQMQDGRLILVFQWFPDSEWFDFPALIISEDAGNTWTDPEPMKLVGYPEDWAVPFDPALVTLPDGRVRMYFTVNPERFSGSTDTYISSAISDDGLIYVYEPGIRFEDTDEDLTRDSTVIYFDERFHIFSPAHSEDGVMNHGVSENGIDFTVEEDITEGESLIWLGNVTTSSTGMRFYGFTNGEIAWADSEDGFIWTQEQRVNLVGADPAVIQLEDGSYLAVVIKFTKKL